MLWPKSFCQSPRRVVDIESHIYIIGQRYACGHKDCKKTYSSWSPAILNVTPQSLAAQFDFHLTYRSGLMDGLASLLRAAFQRGVGPSPFMEIVRTFHVWHYEQLHMQYLEMVLARMQSVSAGLLARHQPFSAWDDPGGYAGFVPSHS